MQQQEFLSYTKAALHRLVAPFIFRNTAEKAIVLHGVIYDSLPPYTPGGYITYRALVIYDRKELHV